MQPNPAPQRQPSTNPSPDTIEPRPAARKSGSRLLAVGVVVAFLAAVLCFVDAGLALAAGLSEYSRSKDPVNYERTKADEANPRARQEDVLRARESAQQARKSSLELINNRAIPRALIAAGFVVAGCLLHGINLQIKKSSEPVIPFIVR